MSLVGIILAGGKSARMGQDKALLKLEGMTLLQRQYRMLEKLLGSGNVFVSGKRSEFPHVEDLEPNLGPVEGVRSVGRSLVQSHGVSSVFVVPVDMPFITDAGFRRLVVHPGRQDITKFKGQQFPIVINDLNRILGAIEAIRKKNETCSAGGYSFKHLFEEVRVEEIPAEPAEFFTNINYPEDWNAALS